MPKHCFVVMTDAVAGRERELDDWYENRHLPDVLSLDGFTAAQRFAFAPLGRWAGPPPHRRLAIYEVDGADARLAAAALEEALDESRRAEAEGRPPRLARTDALAPERAAWWFTAVGRRQRAAGR